MINPDQFRRIVNATLMGFKPIPWTQEAETLLLMTAAHESRLGEFLFQLKGPARGPWQMEPATLKDHYTWLAGKVAMRQAVEGLRPPDIQPVDAIIGNLPFACIMARIHYFRRSGPLPKDLDGMAALAKKVFNTDLGKATVADYRDAYLKYYG